MRVRCNWSSVCLVFLFVSTFALSSCPHNASADNACKKTANDYDMWKEYGHEKTRDDITKRCAIPCVREANSAGGSQDVFKQCLTNCLSDRTIHSEVGAQGPVYTAPCAACFGDWGNCVVKADCARACSNGVLQSDDCQSCMGTTCNPNFKSCAGHSINQIPSSGALSTAALLMGAIGVAFVTYFVLNMTVMKTNKFDLHYGNQDENDEQNIMKDPLLLRTAAERQMTKLTTLAVNTLRLSVKRMPQGGEPLTAVHKFVAENDDELSVFPGETVSGLNEVDGWWVVRNRAGAMGLVPQNIFANENEDVPQEQANFGLNNNNNSNIGSFNNGNNNGSFNNGSNNGPFSNNNNPEIEF